MEAPVAQYQCANCDFPIATHGLLCSYCAVEVPALREEYMALEIQVSRLIGKYEERGVDTKTAIASIREGLLDMTPDVEFYVGYGRA